MATTYTKAKFDKLKLDVAKATFQYGIENDSCETEMVSFIQSSLGIKRDVAQKLFDQAREEATTTHTLTITFKAPASANLKLTDTSLDWDYIENLFESDKYAYIEDVPVLDGSVKATLVKA